MRWAASPSPPRDPDTFYKDALRVAFTMAPSASALSVPHRKRQRETAVEALAPFQPPPPKATTLAARLQTARQPLAAAGPSGAVEEEAAVEPAGPKLPSQLTYEEFMANQRRVPGRGEGDLDDAAIEAIETMGYVMSGNMNRSYQKRVGEQQRVLHHQQAEKQRLDLVGEEHRRRDADALASFARKLERSAPH